MDGSEKAFGLGMSKLIGAAFLAIPSLLVVGFAFGVAQGENPLSDLLVVIGMWFLFALIGSTLLFLRRGLTIDTHRDSAERWYRLMVPLFKRSANLSDFRSIRVSMHARTPEGEKPYYESQADLIGDDDRIFTLFESRDHQDVERIGREVARFLGWPLGHADPIPEDAPSD